MHEREDGPPGTRRIFVGIALPEHVREALNGLREEIKGCRWTAPGNWHLTLKFIGEVDPPLTEAIAEALEPLALEAFLLPVEGVGFFPPKGQPGVLWAGLGRGHPRLFGLQHRVEDALYRLGIAPEKRAYEPHLTLARCRESPAEAVRQWAKRHAGFAAAPFRVDAYHLYQSELRPEGAVHTRIRTWPLRAGPGLTPAAGISG